MKASSRPRNDHFPTTFFTSATTMDPLKLSALAATKDLSAIKTDKKGYISPQELPFWWDCRDIESQFNNFTRVDFMRDNPAPFFASSVSKEFPITRLNIYGETVVVPLSPRDVAFFAGDASRHAVSAPEVVILGQGAKESISRTISAVMGSLKVTDKRDGGQTLALAGLDIFRGGSHKLSTVAKNINHYATIFVILPTFTESTDIRVLATHDAVVEKVRLPEDLSQSVCAVGMFIGVSDARIEVGAGGEIICLTYHASGDPSRVEPFVFPTLENLSGALPPLRDAFCLWRYRLSSGINAPALTLFFLKGFPNSKSTRAFKGYNATLLCHLAPLAKAYGFKMYIARLTYTQSATQEVFHPYKEYLGLDTDFDPSDLAMSDDPDEEYEWGKLCTLGLGGVSVAQSGLLDLATQLVIADDKLKDQLTDVEPEEESEIEDDSPYSATVNLMHIRRASFLFIAP
ncbi:hypothetical protein MVEN_02209800 [Mycena venus]|uniref:Uncharacterized protein n=1 Tax=Mycena venus TaxID=2733690 RepID=A0A8H6X6Z1_9AGAR|nr:hypothetical protein MVEN_02209800 [Mycena venus]